MLEQKNHSKIFKINGVGVNLEQFYPLAENNEKIVLRNKYGFSEKDFILIYTAEFIPRKNHKLLFDILPELNNKIESFKVIFCGKGKLLDYYKDYVRLNAMNYVTFTGYTKDVSDYCRIADILVMPSYQEGLPIAMIEAIATGLPVVASKIRGHTDVIEEYINGFLIDKNDNESYKKAILTLYYNPSLRTEMGKRNVRKAQDFSLNHALDEMKVIYQDILTI